MNRTTLLSLLVGIGLVFSVTGAALGEEPRSNENADRQINELIETAEHRQHENQRVPVLVRLEDRGIQSQAASQAEVSRMAAGLADADVHIQFESAPLLAMSVGPEAVRALAGSPAVRSIREDVPQPPTLNDTMPVINGDTVHDLGWTGSDQTVAILDTGIDGDHEFFDGRIVSEACYSNAGGGGTGTTLCPNEEEEQIGLGASDATVDECFDEFGNNICDHGSHVAGIAAGAADGVLGAPGDGVAPGADIISIQVFTRFDDDDACGGDPGDAPCVLTYTADQILALERVAELNDDFDIAAANMSLGGGESEDHCDGDDRKPIIDDLRAMGIATVTSSGNDGFLNSVGAPGCISTAVTVGSTTNTDGVSGFSNRGPLLDLFAPGHHSVQSSVIAPDFGGKGGTSMAAPHVAGAFAVLQEAYPGADVDTLLGYMETTGVPVTYDIDDEGNEQETTPRLDLLGSLQEGNDPPILTVDEGAVTVDEGATAENTGTFSDPDGDPVTLEASVGTVSDAGGGEWSWSFETRDGPDESQPVTISGTDDKGETGEVTFELVVENVDPLVTIQNESPIEIDEGESVTIEAHYADPGWEDTHQAEIDWGHEVLDAEPTLVADSVGPSEATGTVTATQQYGDTGSFEVTVTVTDDDGGVGTDSITVEVANVDPTAEIDVADAEVTNGEPTFLTEAGVPTSFSGRATDPGSDDLELFWDFGDGNDTSTMYLVNPPDPDPFPSPSIQPRDITDDVEHTYADACFSELSFWAEDDDGGISATDTASVVIAGNADQVRSAGYWLHQYRGNGRIDFSDDQLVCFLEIVDHMSTVFDTMDLGDAQDVLSPGGNQGDMTQLLDRQILTAWLNFANGAIGFYELVDTTGDSVGDTQFSDVMSTAESVRTDPDSTHSELEVQKDLLELVNES